VENRAEPLLDQKRWNPRTQGQPRGPDYEFQTYAEASNAFLNERNVQNAGTMNIVARTIK
jgi:hypothetical protein